jgi:chemotaxis protein CheD
MSRLYDAMDREQVLVAIQEIVTHIIGSEEMALFRCDPASGELWAVMSLGIDPVRLHSLREAQGPIGRVASSRRLFVSDSPPRALGAQTAEPLSACIPLCMDEKVHGVLAIFRLLPQKKAFDEVDHELFTLLGAQVARALYRAELHARHRQDGESSRTESAPSQVPAFPLGR